MIKNSIKEASNTKGLMQRSMIFNFFIQIFFAIFFTYIFFIATKIIYLPQRLLNAINAAKIYEEKFIVSSFFLSLIALIYSAFALGFIAKIYSKYFNNKSFDNVDEKAKSGKCKIKYTKLEHFIFIAFIFLTILLIYFTNKIIKILGFVFAINLYYISRIYILDVFYSKKEFKNIFSKFIYYVIYYVEEILVHIILYFSIFSILQFLIYYMDPRAAKRIFSVVLYKRSIIQLISIFSIIIIEELIFRKLIYHLSIFRLNGKNLKEFCEEKYLKLSSNIYAIFKALEAFAIYILINTKFMQQNSLSLLVEMFLCVYILNYIKGKIFGKIYLRTNFFILILFRILIDINVILPLLYLIIK